MATAALPSVWAAAARAWRDAFRALSAMRRLCFVVFMTLLAIELAQRLLLAMSYDPTLAHGFSARFEGLIFTAIWSVLLAPFAIAVHRFVLLDERTAGYRMDLADRRFLCFALYGVLLAILTGVPGLLGAALALVWSPLDLPIVFVLGIVVTIISVRAVILFPAVAVDAADPSWRGAAEDTKGHSWHVFFVLLVSVLPIAVLFNIVESFTDSAWRTNPLAWVALTGASNAALELLETAALVAAASRLYWALGRTPGPVEAAVIA